MIVAIGTDIVQIERIESAMKNPEFVNRILTPTEQEREITPQYVAGRWAVKEAIKKCLPNINSWHDAEVISEPGSPPTVSLAPGLLPSQHSIHVSISHETRYATAIAILEGPG
ncbi:MAG: holo-ACP synthase [Fimbriimonadaceae bacterium]|nr:MAG: holo-ACP synthase [Fimbriimonadaceae bacterium]